jgi:Transglutaminase-like superfamily
MSARHPARSGEVQPSEDLLRLFQLWWAMRVGVWLCGLRLRWRGHSLPGLLRRLTPVRRHVSRRSTLELDQAVQTMRQIGRLRLFRGPLFPQGCLQQALALYYLLSRLGYPVTIHVGVYQAGEALCGPRWVTVDGRPVAERTPPEGLAVLSSFPGAVSCPTGAVGCE